MMIYVGTIAGCSKMDYSFVFFIAFLFTESTLKFDINRRNFLLLSLTTFFCIHNKKGKIYLQVDLNSMLRFLYF